jgi:3-oxoacyl-[acyl-carrier-protein] synthase II
VSAIRGDPRRVVVTGIGAVTAAGSGPGSAPDGLWAGVASGHLGVGPITRFDPAPFRTRVAAQVDGFDATDHMDAKQARRLDRFAQFACACGRMALQDAALVLNGEANDAAVYLGSALGGIAFAEAQHARFMEGGLRAVDPALALAVFGGSGATAMAMDLGIRGPAVGTPTAAPPARLRWGRHSVLFVVVARC